MAGVLGIDRGKREGVRVVRGEETWLEEELSGAIPAVFETVDDAMIFYFREEHRRRAAASPRLTAKESTFSRNHATSAVRDRAFAALIPCFTEGADEDGPLDGRWLRALRLLRLEERSLNEVAGAMQVDWHTAKKHTSRTSELLRRRLGRRRLLRL